ncbi:hypothetical protein HGRIS_010368 [Hohenbuehelia grisea]|uniref:Uncharacterized protein n=1 Tax=Hohenbuehelia grisea TaxID=104357 RepID=A0ABR3J4R5_9AGAR
MFSVISRASTRSQLARRALHNTRVSLSKSSHSTDTYAKDVDSAPPPDEKMHRVDPNSENAQKPYEAPSGQWSQASTKHGAYQHVSDTKPYDVNGRDQRYGGKEDLVKEKGAETSNSGEGPEGQARGGRKPEGK